jgi:hypothetical protein
MTCARSWKLAVIMACDATIAARIAMTKLNQNVPGGTVLKKGLVNASPVAIEGKLATLQ